MWKHFEQFVVKIIILRVKMLCPDSRAYLEYWIVNKINKSVEIKSRVLYSLYNVFKRFIPAYHTSTHNKVLTSSICLVKKYQAALTWEAAVLKQLQQHVKLLANIAKQQ